MRIIFTSAKANSGTIYEQYILHKIFLGYYYLHIVIMIAFFRIRDGVNVTQIPITCLQ